MSYDLQGKLHQIDAEIQVSDKFKKRELVVEVPDGNYTNFIKLQFTQDKCGLLDQYTVGDEVKVAFNLSGKPFTKEGKTLYFTNLQAWKIEGVSTYGKYTEEPAKQPVTAGNDDADNDLPF